MQSRRSLCGLGQRGQGSAQRSGALDYPRRQAEAEASAASAALADLPNSKYRESLLQLADFAVTRNF